MLQPPVGYVTDGDLIGMNGPIPAGRYGMRTPPPRGRVRSGRVYPYISGRKLNFM
jgi:hypothetical protein